MTKPALLPLVCANWGWGKRGWLQFLGAPFFTETARQIIIQCPNFSRTSRRRGEHFVVFEITLEFFHLPRTLTVTDCCFFPFVWLWQVEPKFREEKSSFLNALAEEFSTNSNTRNNSPFGFPSNHQVNNTNETHRNNSNSDRAPKFGSNGQSKLVYHPTTMNPNAEIFVNNSNVSQCLDPVL